MDKPARYKAKNKKQPDKKKSAKKRHSDGPTCSMFLSEMTRKFRQKKRDEENEAASRNIVQTIIESISNALPVKFSKSSAPQKKESPMQIETLQTLAPELVPNDTLNLPHLVPDPKPEFVERDIAVTEFTPARSFKMPRMPLMSSDVFKTLPQVLEKQAPVEVEDASVNTSSDHDVATEIAKHVATLRKISLIAEEFNQKTAKNLKEIVDSVQEDLIKKLEEIRAEKAAALLAATTASITGKSVQQQENEKKGK